MQLMVLVELGAVALWFVNGRRVGKADTPSNGDVRRQSFNTGCNAGISIFNAGGMMTSTFQWRPKTAIRRRRVRFTF